MSYHRPGSPGTKSLSTDKTLTEEQRSTAVQRRQFIAGAAGVLTAGSGCLGSGIGGPSDVEPTTSRWRTGRTQSSAQA